MGDGNKKNKNDSIVALYYHKELEQFPIKTVLKKILKPGKSFVRYRIFNDVKYRLIQHVDNSFNEKQIEQFKNLPISRKSAESAVNTKNKIINSAYLEIQKKVNEKLNSPALKLETIEAKDIKYIRKYLLSPKAFNNKYGSIVNFNELKKVYDANLAPIIESKEKVIQFSKLKTLEEKNQFIKKNIKELNYRKLIYSKPHCELILNKISPTNKIVNFIKFYEKKSTSKVFDSGYFLYNWYTYNGLDVDKHPVKVTVEGLATGYIAKYFVTSIITLAELTLCPELLLITFIAEIAISSFLKDIIDNISKYLVTDKLTIKNYKDKLNSNEEMKIVYNAIVLFFEKYATMILRIKSNFLTTKEVNSNPYNFYSPKPLSNDNLDSKKFMPKNDLFSFIPLHQEEHVKICHEIIIEYLKEIEMQYMAKDILAFNKDNIFTHSETTKVSNIPQPLKKNNKRDLLYAEINAFNMVINSWNETSEDSIPPELTNSHLFMFLEPFL